MAPVRFGIFVPQGWILDLVDIQDPVEKYEAMSRVARTAERLGHRSWVEHPDDMAIEELLLLDPDLLRAVVQRELGPLLSDARMGEELLETLQAYVDAGSNKREVARRLHVAARTVAYRIERIEELLGVRLEGPALTRLSVALLAHRLLGGSTP